MKFKDKLPQAPVDKANHFIYGFMLFMFFSCFFIPLTAFTLTVVVACSVEFYDSVTDGNVEFMDILFTILPGSILYLFNLLN